jgi:hypothetical protein
MPASTRRVTVPTPSYGAGDGISDADFEQIRNLTLERDKQDRRCRRWLGVDNQKLLRAMRRRARAEAQRSRLLYGQAAGDTVQAQADRAHYAFCAQQNLDWNRSI